ncbi:hypothetical protein MRX96_051978 [Rhipicephalus microplus]
MAPTATRRCLDFRTSNCHHLSIPTTKIQPDLERVNITNVAPFKGVDPAGWNAVLDDLMRPIFPRVQVLKRRKGNDIDKALGRLAADASVGGAFVIQHTVIELYGQLLSYTMYDVIRDRRECFANMLKIPFVEEAFRAQVVSSPVIEMYLQNLSRV